MDIEFALSTNSARDTALEMVRLSELLVEDLQSVAWATGKTYDREHAAMARDLRSRITMFYGELK